MPLNDIYLSSTFEIIFFLLQGKEISLGNFLYLDGMSHKRVPFS